MKPPVDAVAVPELTKQSQNTETPSAAVPNGWNDRGAVGLAFSLDLDLWGKNRAASRAAQAEAQSARYEFDEARLAITTGIASAYAELASLYAQRDSLDDALNIRTKSATLVKQRVDIGLDTQAESRQATARVAQARADIEATDEAIAYQERRRVLARAGRAPGRSSRLRLRCSRRRAFPPMLRRTGGRLSRTSLRSARSGSGSPAN